VLSGVSPPRALQTSGFIAQRPTNASDANAGDVIIDASVAAPTAQLTNHKHFIEILSLYVWQLILAYRRVF
jgi:hypothetical protein